MLLPLFFLFLRGSQSHKKNISKSRLSFFDSPWLRKLETQPTFWLFKKMLGFHGIFAIRLPRSLLGYAVGALTSTFDIPPETPIQTLLGGEKLWQSVCEVGWFKQVIVTCIDTSSMYITIICTITKGAWQLKVRVARNRHFSGKVD